MQVYAITLWLWPLIGGDIEGIRLRIVTSWNLEGSPRKTQVRLRAYLCQVLPCLCRLQTGVWTPPERLYKAPTD